ncbi:G-protein coupled receptor Mth2-like isoform X14 [Diabrotica virgifera virgifera]|uniref:G-protein coupled receptor Mth2-like n=1 Tax=Diabrotica virgifera virgifera TaxID=50390 RepID=A0ABM5KWW9_DIAVI|nr:G-protein coupled receptor Mth2-like isoform X14 [Diabrotica virgifera virgifera]
MTSTTMRFYELIFLIICMFSSADSVTNRGNISRSFDGCDLSVNCIRKCCPVGYSYVGKPRKCRVNNSSEPFIAPVYNKTFFVGTVDQTAKFRITDITCLLFRLQNDNPKDFYYLQEDGKLFVPSYNRSYPNNEYCIDEVYTLSAFLCFPEQDVTEPPRTPLQKSNSAGMIISMPFLLLTFLVYLLLPERNLHRRALMSYVFTLLAAYITLVTIQLYSGQFPDTTCHVLGYLIIFFFLVSFFWMNVMCVDMWLAFSGMRTFLSKKTAERKRFIIYCIYAWGMPIVHVLIVFLINHYGSTDTSWNPQIGVKRCFLGEGMPTFYYFYLPMAILIGINITLFVLTTVRIQKIKKETSMLKQTDSRRHTYEDDKQKFNLYLKLMFAMGVNWITELVSWAVDYAFSETPAYVWYITDFTNAMYGVLIFLIFVFKKKIWRSLKKKYYICIGKPHLAHSMTTSSARGTRTSNYSTTDTTAVSTDYRLSDMKNGKIPEESALNRT